MCYKGAKSVAMEKLVNIGYNTHVVARRIISLLPATSMPVRRLREEAKARGYLIDATQGRKTRSLVVTDSNHVILSAVNVETLLQRFVEGTAASQEM